MFLEGRHRLAKTAVTKGRCYFRYGIACIRSRDSWVHSTTVLRRNTSKVLVTDSHLLIHRDSPASVKVLEKDDADVIKICSPRGVVVKKAGRLARRK